MTVECGKFHEIRTDMTKLWSFFAQERADKLDRNQFQA